MDKKPWFKFYPSDWRADQALRLCSLAARGLWVECMALMHEAKPYGHLVVNGRRVTDSQLALLTGAPVDQITALLGELENAGVSSKRGDGVIYSRRMTRDAKRSAEGTKYGKQGGNPALTHKPTLNHTPPHDPSPRGQRLEPDLEIPKEGFLGNVALSLSSNRLAGKPWTAAQKKAAWQGKICAEAQATMAQAEYAAFLEGWTTDEPKAVRLAEQINERIQSRKTA